MFLQQLPDAARWPLLFVVGAILGALVNLAIYRLAIYKKRNISPWSLPPSEDRPRSWLDRIPILGWIFLRRESDVYGPRHWVRPLMIEVALGIGLAWFFDWYHGGGLYGGSEVSLTQEQADLIGQWNLGWYLFHMVLLALMVIATFIDFDEQTIPDWITIPGTVFALLCHAISPALRLPVVTTDLLSIRLEPLDFWSPGTPSDWHLGPLGLVAGLAIVLIWCVVLLPWFTSFRLGFRKGVEILLASVIKPRRKTESRVPRVKQRRMPKATLVLLGLAVALAALVVVMHSMVGGPQWTTLMDSLLGLAMGGGIVWAVRIIAGRALGVEAMGFGDVTLMCMVGAFVGWQGALLAFVIAPFTSIVVALIQLVTSGENRLAFGPYLCLGTAIVVIGWSWVWNQWASNGVFAMGSTFLLGTIITCLVMMAIMLWVWGKFKYRNE